MKRYGFAIGLLSLVLSISCSAQDARGNPIMDLRDQVMSKVALFEMETSSGSPADASDVAKQGEAALDGLIEPALKAAAGNADLKASIKAFYVSAKTYFDTAGTFVPLPEFDSVTLDSHESPEEIALKQNRVTMKQDVEAKEHAMMLEAKLAGIDGR